ncbi:hypothetical protein SDC9_186684 [bioreactor metagenome]|uniref:Uncharacterized protein n=1 Tax=bioreactor metagenome TaxID=1076179 RepID=A0A645HKL6_9ZZZZ
MICGDRSLKINVGLRFIVILIGSSVRGVEVRGGHHAGDTLNFENLRLAVLPCCVYDDRAEERKQKYEYDHRQSDNRKLAAEEPLGNHSARRHHAKILIRDYFDAGYVRILRFFLWFLRAGIRALSFFIIRHN